MKMKRGKARVVNLTRGEILLAEAEVAGTFFRRLKGLLGRSELSEESGMLLIPCRGIHTVGMSFPLDVAFVDRENRICFLLEALPPYRFTPGVRKAAFALEAPAGTFRRKQTRVGDEIKVEVCRNEF